LAEPPDFRALRIGETVLLTGRLFTARDRAHRWLLENDFPPLQNGIVFHCGPIIQGNTVVAAGPTTSDRLNQYTPALIEKYALRAIIGKGGMDASVSRALSGRAIYLAAVGGAGLIAAHHLTLVTVHKPEFGMAEAIWELEARDLPLIVGMDAHGGSIYAQVLERSQAALQRLV
jgi:fumarate hydratase subunit beta